MGDLLTALVLSSPTGVPKDVQPYFNSFRTNVQQFKDIPTGFYDVNTPDKAECIQLGGNKYIALDKTTWANMDDKSREALMYHELGHCVLGLPDNAQKSGGYCPPSAMNEHAVDGNCWGVMRQQYIDDLKKAGANGR